VQISKTIKISALIGFALFFIFVVIPPFTRKWARNHFIRYSSIIPTNNWKKFTSLEGKFSIWFPGDPECTNVVVGISGVDLTTPCYFVWNRQMEFAANYSVFPKILEKLTPAQKYDICQAAVGRDVGKIVFQKDILIEGYPAREFEYDVVGKVNYSGRVELLLVNDRLYQLIFIFLTGYPHPPDRDLFFNSLRFQK
jgi:hypothetical protein